MAYDNFENREIYNVEDDGTIHLLGYYYESDDGWRGLSYNVEFSLRDWPRLEYDSVDLAIEYSKHWIDDFDSMEEAYEFWQCEIADRTQLDLSAVDENTPPGRYYD